MLITINRAYGATLKWIIVKQKDCTMQFVFDSMEGALKSQQSVASLVKKQANH